MNKNSFYFLLVAMVSLFQVGCINDNATYRQMVFVDSLIYRNQPDSADIVLDRKNIVNNMHEAYDRIGMDDRYNFGTFISGPSKTADIEQALVMGAQAARGVTVVLVDEQWFPTILYQGVYLNNINIQIHALIKTCLFPHIFYKDIRGNQH